MTMPGTGAMPALLVDRFVRNSLGFSGRGPSISF